MKNIKVLFIFLPLIIVSAMGCNNEPEESIDQELLIYVERFIFEANERDFTKSDGSALTVESLGIEVDFTNIPNPAVIGRCQRDEFGNNLAITIDPLFWKASTELEKEYVMFHELGHCVLSRAHSTDADNNNTCLSIMEPGTGELCTSNYTTTTRAKLLDELFDF